LKILLKNWNKGGLMKKKNENQVSNEILSLYQRQNPTKLTNLNKAMASYINNLENNLKFPLIFLKNMNVLDIGCGTGTNALIYALNSAKVEGYDFNEEAISLARKLHATHKINNSSFYCSDFYDSARYKKFDFVSCTGVLHHLHDPIKGFRFLTNKLNSNGFLFISMGLSSSNLQHNLMKLIVRNWGTSDEEIIFAAKELFSTHISRCVKYGHRDEKTVIFDQFLNPHQDNLDLSSILKVAESSNLKLHTSWPPPFVLKGDSATNNTDNETQADHFELSQYYWSMKSISDNNLRKNNNLKNLKSFKEFNDFCNFINDLQLNSSLSQAIEEKKYKKFLLKPSHSNKVVWDFNANKQFEIFNAEINELMEILSKNLSIKKIKSFIKKTKILFKETSGLGLNNLLFIKK
jgi:2-polyprenyl-3-methyl-5-hydroxy-6-metoxy-1,4-benzoquinol methylase